MLEPPQGQAGVAGHQEQAPWTSGQECIEALRLVWFKPSRLSWGQDPEGQGPAWGPA